MGQKLRQNTAAVSDKLSEPLIQQLVAAASAAVRCSNGFLWDFISLSHGCGGILAHSSFQRCFSSLRFAALVYAQLSEGPTTAFQSG